MHLCLWYLFNLYIELKYVGNVQLLQTIHTLQLNFLVYDWLFSKYAECIENIHCTPRTAPTADYARCIWCMIVRVNVTSTDQYFSLGKVVNILYVYWHFKAILFIIIHEHEQGTTSKPNRRLTGGSGRFRPVFIV